MTQTMPYSSVYLTGDSVPINTSLSVEEVATRMMEAADMGRHTGPGIAFVRLPCPGKPDALARLDAITAIVPYSGEDEDEDE